MAFGSLFSGVTKGVTTFNAPGFKSTATNQAFFSALGGASAHVPTGTVTTNVIADEAAQGLPPWSAIAGRNSRPGVAIDIAIENQAAADISGAPIALNHSQPVLTDALSVASLISDFAPGLSVAQINTLLKSAGSNARTLENTLDALRTLLVDSSIATDPARQTPTGDRDALYANLYALRNNANYTTLKGSASLTLLAGASASTVASQALTDFGSFLALSQLLPFTLAGQTSTLSAVHSSLYATWQADQTARGSGSTAITYSKEWMNDRAAMLSWKLKAQADDTAFDSTHFYVDAPSASVSGDVWDFQDEASGSDVMVRPQGAIAPDIHHVWFGSDGNSFLVGDAVTDRLYGMAGDDTLRGMAGNDYLDGGTGNDTLEGGTGFDTYGFGQGADTIIDSDGQGRLMDGQGRQLYGTLAKQSDGSYLLTGRPDVTATLSGSTLTLNLASGASVTINSFVTGQLGLTLADAIATPTAPVPTLTLRGDYVPKDVNTGLPGVQYGYDGLGNVLLEPGPLANPGFNDTLYGSTGSDLLQGLDGNDILDGKAGADKLDGGNGADSLVGGDGNDLALGGLGDDWITGNLGNDRLQGDAGNDIANGNDGDDVVLGGLGNDIVAGEAGKDLIIGEDELTVADAYANGNSETGTGVRGDWLDGGTDDDQLLGAKGNDFLTGGDGNDLIIAGAGDDVVHGDQHITGGDKAWAVARSRTYDGSTRTYTYADNLTHGTVQDSTATTNTDDALYGGAGADWLYGELGNDVLDGGDGDDDLLGGAADDQLIGGSGNDFLWGDDMTTDQAGTSGAANQSNWRIVA